MCKGVAKPFLKWAGGKGQLINKLNELYPYEIINGEIKTYIEPFVGGGAILFDILQKFHIEKALIIDSNKELINCYACIKADVRKLIERLKNLQEEYLGLSLDERAGFYSNMRTKYNTIKLNGHFDFEKATDFIFLNKTCFNGLYRVNKNGEFNVPFGKYKNPLICDESNLLSVGKLLQKVEIRCGDYTQCGDFIDNTTFVYLDPPYRPITATQSFVGYSQNGFNDDNQKELSNFIKNVSKTGAKILLSNSDPKNVNTNDNFFDDLYSDFDMQRIYAKRIINCQAKKRGDITEIVVRNYKGNAVLMR
ncbi:MAG: DNA adenine methylase [Clostridiales bacterium]|jgi:DNA adenine methylase|nr:DNA adenine methylase [Clostridiales bacterium]